MVVECRAFVREKKECEGHTWQWCLCGGMVAIGKARHSAVKADGVVVECCNTSPIPKTGSVDMGLTAL